MAFEITDLVAAPLHDMILARHWLEVDHGEVAAALEVAYLIEHIGNAARHAGSEVAARRPDHHHHAAGHIFAAMVAGALDHGDSAGVAHGETFAGDAAEITLAGDCAVQHRVADDDRFFGNDAGIGRRPHDEASAREALADVVVAFAFEIKRDTVSKPGAEALSGDAGELDMDGVVGKSDMAVAFGHFTGKHRAAGPIGILDRRHHAHGRAAIERGLRLRNQFAIEDLADLVILFLTVMDRHALGR